MIGEECIVAPFRRKLQRFVMMVEREPKSDVEAGLVDICKDLYGFLDDLQTRLVQIDLRLGAVHPIGKKS
jgi:hypothetical protein